MTITLLSSLLADPAWGKSRRTRSKKKNFSSSVHLRKVGECKPAVVKEPEPEASTEGEKDEKPKEAIPAPTKKVLILKQWHLPPTTITKGFKEKYPQEQNQTALYKFLDENVKNKELQLIVGEGCEGEINSEFKTAFNGWDYNSLHAQYGQKSYSKIISQVPLKIEAKHGDRISTFCGDNDAAIQQANLRLSNLRGWMGFLDRLDEYKDNPEKQRPYIDAAADLLKAPKDTHPDQLVVQIKERIKLDLEAFNKSLQERDESFVKTLTDQDFKQAAVVIGGLHADDLKEKIEAAGMNCVVYEPPGYQPLDEKLIQEFQKARLD
jgi:hypothetical protein